MSDRRIPLIVVATLALVVVLGATFEGYLAAAHTPIPDQLDRLVVGCLGALSAILATTRADVQPVQVMNKEADAVPVEPQP
jgi:hypothetical protein